MSAGATVNIGDVVIVPEGHGSASGKIGRVIYIGTLRAWVEVPMTGIPGADPVVKVSLRELEQQAERKRVEAEQTNIRC